MSLQVRSFRDGASASDKKRDEGLTTPEDIIRCDNLFYAPDGIEEHKMDIYYPKGTNIPLPVIVSIHGGGWVYGSKEVYQFYCMSLAQRGFTVVNFNYRLAPESKYPAPLKDICQLFFWIGKHKEAYNIDDNAIYIVGDSAGAQLASQFAVMVTNPEYRKLFSFPVPEITIRALALNCGVYDIKRNLVSTKGNAVGLGREYFPKLTKNVLRQLKVLNYITEAFPPTFVMGSVNDPVSTGNASDIIRKLKENKIPFEESWYGQGNEAVQHVFHCNIRLPEAVRCNDQECGFFRKYSPPASYVTT